MTTEEQKPLPSPPTASSPAAPPVAQRRRLRYRVLRALLATFVLGCICVGVIAYWITTDGFERRLKSALITQIADATGGRVELNAFHWNPWHLEVEVQGLTIHGLESASEKPYAYLERGSLRLRLLSLLWPRAGVHSLLLEHPQIHLILNADGTTNQPTPKHKKASGKPSSLETLFDLEAGSVIVSQGELLLNERSLPFNLSARDLHLVMLYQPAFGKKDSYRLRMELASLTMRDSMQTPVNLHLKSEVVLHRDTLTIEQFEILTNNKKLHIEGDLTHFANPTWHAKADGEVDLKEVQDLIQEEGKMAGIATIHAHISGQAAAYLGEANVKVPDATYNREGAHVLKAHLTAHLRMTEKDIDVDGIEIHPQGGGVVHGEVKINRWDIPMLGSIRVNKHDKPIVRSASVYGIAEGISIAQTMQIVGEGAYQDIGFRSNIYGTALVEWTRDATDLTVKAEAQLHAPAEGKGIPLEGSARGIYIDLPGRVDVGSIDLHTPASEFHASGPLGVYPTSQRSGINISLTTQDLNEFNTLLGLSEGYSDEKAPNAKPPVALHGTAQFVGKMNGSFDEPGVNGRLEANDIWLPMPAAAGSNKQTTDLHWDHILFRGEVSDDHLHLDEGQLTEGTSKLTMHGSLDAQRFPKKLPHFDEHSKLDATLDLTNFDRQHLATIAGLPGNNSGTIQAHIKAHGIVDQLVGSFSVAMPGGQLAGEPIHNAALDGTVTGTVVQLHALNISQNGGSFNATGAYDWRSHHYKGHALLQKINFEHLATLQSQPTKLTGILTAIVDGDGTLDHPKATLSAHLEGLTVAGSAFGSPDLQATLNGDSLAYQVKSQFNAQSIAEQISILGTTQLNQELTTQAKVEFSNFVLQPIVNLAQVQGGEGTLKTTGILNLSGPLNHIQSMTGDVSLRDLYLEARDVHMQNDGTIHATLRNGSVQMDEAHITGEGTDLRLGGSIGLLGDMPLALKGEGSVNLKLLEAADHDLSASGLMNFKLNALGTVKNPNLAGQVEFKNSSLALQDLPNGLSQMNGVLVFSDGRLVVKSLTAMTGGGQLRFGGSITYHSGLYADLTATGSNVRIRYPQGVSSLADANLRLQGPQTNMLLSGNVLLTRFSVNPDMDMAAVAGSAISNTTIASSNAPSNHIRLDVHITSAPQLNFQNSYAKLAGDVDLRVRGTVASPSILGKVSITEGSGTFNGTKYQLQHGDIYFTNPVRVEPLIDLTATAQIQEYDISIVVHGTPDRMNVSYRSEPALSQADVIGLLAMGRRQDEQRLNAQQQVTPVVNPSTDALLGSALNATLSNRVRKLFGTATVKIDPTVVGTLGNTTARVTVDQQVGKNVIITYAANVNTTAQQFIQAEIQLNRTISLVAVRDETGVASMVLKIQKRYR